MAVIAVIVDVMFRCCNFNFANDYNNCHSSLVCDGNVIFVILIPQTNISLSLRYVCSSTFNYIVCDTKFVGLLSVSVL